MKKKLILDTETIKEKKDTPQFEYQTGEMMEKVKKELATFTQDKKVKKFLKLWKKTWQVFFLWYNIGALKEKDIFFWAYLLFYNN